MIESNQERANNLALAQKELQDALANRNKNLSGFFVKEIGAKDETIYHALGVTPTEILKVDQTPYAPNTPMTKTIFATNTPDTTIITKEIFDKNGQKKLISRSIKVLSSKVYDENMQDKSSFT